jgi:hypothetical protein
MYNPARVMDILNNINNSIGMVLYRFGKIKTPSVIRFLMYCPALQVLIYTAPGLIKSCREVDYFIRGFIFLFKIECMNAIMSFGNKQLF